MYIELLMFNIQYALECFSQILRFIVKIERLFKGIYIIN